jgi:glycosyltransferase involved in cell wall biosynthesis
MKITIIHASYYYSGSEKSVELLARWLMSNGHEVNIISVGRYSAPDDLKAIERNILPNADKALTLKALLPMARAMRYYEINTDIYHIYNVFPMAAAGLYKLLGGKKPVIATLNNYAGFCPSASAIYNECDKLSCKIRCLKSTISKINNSNTVYIYLYCMIYPLLTNLSKKLDRYIAVSGQVKDMYIKYGYNNDKIIIIPEFSYLDCLPNILKYDSYDSPNKLLYVGTIHRHKGVDLLIEALNIIKNKYGYVDISLTIVGKGDDKYEDYCKKLVIKYNLVNNIRFLGYISEDELDKIYSIHHIFIHPARWHEPFGRAIIEALSHGLPCIVSDTVSRDIVEDVGLIFKKDDVLDLVDKILLIINDKMLYRQLSNNTRNIINRFDINNIGKKIIDVYLSLL